MNLQDELTPEFLRWVLDIRAICIHCRRENSIDVSTTFKWIGIKEINLDTLTRLIKEKILAQHKYSIMIDYDVDMFRSDSLRFSLRLVTRDGVTKFKAKDCEELEAVIQAGIWVKENTND